MVSAPEHGRPIPRRRSPACVAVHLDRLGDRDAQRRRRRRPGADERAAPAGGAPHAQDRERRRCRPGSNEHGSPPGLHLTGDRATGWASARGDRALRGQAGLRRQGLSLPAAEGSAGARSPSSQPRRRRPRSRRPASVGWMWSALPRDRLGHERVGVEEAARRGVLPDHVDDPGVLAPEGGETQTQGRPPMACDDAAHGGRVGRRIDVGDLVGAEVDDHEIGLRVGDEQLHLRRTTWW